MTGDLSGKTKLKSVQEEKDLGVLNRSDIKSVSQCHKSAATARRVTGMVKRHFRHLDMYRRLPDYIQDIRGLFQKFPALLENSGYKLSSLQ